MSLMVSISGIRGIIGKTLTPDVVIKYISGYAKFCNNGHIVIGRDGRITGKNISDIAISTLLQMGCNVTDLGICPTPTVALAIEKLNASGGIAITASHNPMMWNGMKFFSSSGLFLDPQENKIFWDLCNTPAEYKNWDEQGKYICNNNFLDEHINCGLSLKYIDIKKIRSRKFRVVLDCINAAGGIIVPKLLEKLGCTIIPINCDVSGIFSHTPEPIPENLTLLAQKVVDSKADIGIAVDPDVDRLVLINEKGEPYGEEYTIATCVKFILEKSFQNNKSQKNVVVNLSTTRAVEDIAKNYNANVIRTPVGEINVAKKMKEVGAIIGGEGSGGVILPEAHLGRDAIIGITLILQMLAENQKTISEIKNELPHYHITKGKVEVGNIVPDIILNQLQNEFAKTAKINIDDGLKIDFAESWVHLRKSNTEPIIRIIAEAHTKSEADNLVKQFTDKILGK